jgi:hypothetical protein
VLQSRNPLQINAFIHLCYRRYINILGQQLEVFFQVLRSRFIELDSLYAIKECLSIGKEPPKRERIATTARTTVCNRASSWCKGFDNVRYEVCLPLCLHAPSLEVFAKRVTGCPFQKREQNGNGLPQLVIVHGKGLRVILIARVICHVTMNNTVVLAMFVKNRRIC